MKINLDEIEKSKDYQKIVNSDGSITYSHKPVQYNKEVKRGSVTQTGTYTPVTVTVKNGQIIDYQEQKVYSQTRHTNRQTFAVYDPTRQGIKEANRTSNPYNLKSVPRWEKLRQEKEGITPAQRADAEKKYEDRQAYLRSDYAAQLKRYQDISAQKYGTKYVYNVDGKQLTNQEYNKLLYEQRQDSLAKIQRDKKQLDKFSPEQYYADTHSYAVDKTIIPIERNGRQIGYKDTGAMQSVAIGKDYEINPLELERVEKLRSAQKIMNKTSSSNKSKVNKSDWISFTGGRLESYKTQLSKNELIPSAGERSISEYADWINRKVWGLPERLEFTGTNKKGFQKQALMLSATVTGASRGFAKGFIAPFLPSTYTNIVKSVVSPREVFGGLGKQLATQPVVTIAETAGYFKGFDKTGSKLAGAMYEKLPVKKVYVTEHPISTTISKSVRGKKAVLNAKTITQQKIIVRSPKFLKMGKSTTGIPRKPLSNILYEPATPPKLRVKSVPIKYVEEGQQNIKGYRETSEGLKETVLPYRIERTGTANLKYPVQNQKIGMENIRNIKIDNEIITPIIGKPLKLYQYKFSYDNPFTVKEFYPVKGYSYVKPKYGYTASYGYDYVLKPEISSIPVRFKKIKGVDEGLLGYYESNIKKGIKPKIFISKDLIGSDAALRTLRHEVTHAGDKNLLLMSNNKGFNAPEIKDFVTIGKRKMQAKGFGASTSRTFTRSYLKEKVFDLYKKEDWASEAKAGIGELFPEEVLYPTTKTGKKINLEILDVEPILIGITKKRISTKTINMPKKFRTNDFTQSSVIHNPANIAKGIIDYTGIIDTFRLKPKYVRKSPFSSKKTIPKSTYSSAQKTITVLEQSEPKINAVTNKPLRQPIKVSLQASNKMISNIMNVNSFAPTKTKAVQIEQPLSIQVPFISSDTIRSQLPLTSIKPVEVILPASSIKPISLINPVMGTRNIQVKKPIRLSQPIQVNEPIEILKPIQVQQPIQILKPIQIEEPIKINDIFKPKIIIPDIPKDRIYKRNISMIFKQPKKTRGGYTFTLWGSLLPKIRFSKGLGSRVFTGLEARPKIRFPKNRKKKLKGLRGGMFGIPQF